MTSHVYSWLLKLATLHKPTKVGSMYNVLVTVERNPSNPNPRIKDTL